MANFNSTVRQMTEMF